MRKIYLLIIISVFTKNTFAQVDTTFSETVTAAKAAQWLKDLKLSQDTGRIGLFQGAMGPLGLGNTAINIVDTTSVLYLYSDSLLFSNALKVASINMKNYFVIARQLGGYIMRSPESFSWGMIEPDSGKYFFQLYDTIMKYADLNNIHVLGTIDVKNDFAMECNDSNTMCPLFTGSAMYWVNNGKTGPICNEDTVTYINFIRKTVERYDGDGISDMPGLINPIRVWEFANEPWYQGCTNYTAIDYLRDIRITATAIKSACSECSILNGGWDHETDSMYWDSVFTYGQNYIDIANIHVNEPRTEPFDFDNDMGIQTRMIDRKRDSLGINWNTWVTEWGIYHGSPTSGINSFYLPLPYVSEEEQAANYAKFYAWGLSENISMFFYDEQGDSISGIGSSSLLEKGSGYRHLKLSVYTLKLLESKFREIDSASAESFSTDSAFQYGNIRIWKDGDPTEVLWGLDSLPWYLTGPKIVTDIYGNMDTLDVALIPLPLSSNPIIIEEYSPISNINYPESLIFKLYPNPTENKVTIQFDRSLNNYSLKIYNSMLQLMIEKNNGINEIDVSALNAGIYFVDIIQNKKHNFRKLVIHASN